jgi:ParB-like chromosome segregation protein Spo0J
MSNRFNLDTSSIDSDLEKDAESFSIKPVNSSAPSGHSKLPDLSDVQRLFKSKDEQKNILSSNNTSSSNINSINGQRDKGNSVQSRVLVDGNENIKSNEEIEKREVIENSPKGHEVVLFLDQVLSDPKDNISRGCKPWQKTDHEVITLAHLIRTNGLINPSEVSELDEPIENTNPNSRCKFYTHKVCSGFKRFAALQYLGFDTYRFTIFDGLSDDDKLIHNGIENYGRSDPTDYDLALYIALLHRKRNWTPQRIAIEIGGKSGRVESLLLIATKLPPELLEVFRVQPTPEVRRDLAKISLIERETKEETHKAMMAEWIRIENERKKTEDIRSNIGPSTGNNRNHSNSNSNKSASGNNRLVELRNEQSSASQWFDSLTNTYKPITEDMREYADMIFRHLSDRKLRSPFR